MSLQVSVGILFVLTVGNYWLKRSVLYPPFMFCTMWLMATGLDLLDLVTTDVIDRGTLAFVTVGAAIFTLGGLIALLVPEALIEAKFVLTRFPQRNNLVKPLLVLFLLCGIPMEIQSLRAEAAQGQGDTFFERARNAGIEAQRNGQAIEGMSSGISIYFVSWTVFTSVLFMLIKRDRAFWFVAFAALISCVLTTGRTSLLQLFAALICVHLMTSRRLNFSAALKMMRLPFLMFLSLYIGLVFINKSGQSQQYGTGIAQIAGVFFVSYIVGPLAAFSVFMQNPGSMVDVPNHTFKFFLGIISHLHLINYTPAPMLQEFVGVPYPVNVYTMYKDYVIDFGISGALFAAFVIGLLHTVLYRKALAGSLLGNFLFALSIFPVVMAIFTDQYSSFGNYIDALLFGAIFIVLQSLPIRVLPRLREGYGVPVV